MGMLVVIFGGEFLCISEVGLFTSPIEPLSESGGVMG